MTNPGRRGWVIAFTALALTLAACGNAAERNLCRQYEDLQETVAQLEGMDPETATAADLLAVVEDVTVQLDQFQAASDGLYDQAVSNLNLALTDLRQVTFDLGDESIEVARPLIQESWDNTVTAYSLLRQRLDVVCGTD
jgi:HAMP domain-containing protein